MLRGLELPTLKERRKGKRLIQMYNVHKDSVPAIPPNAYLKPIVSKRRSKAKSFSDFESKNIVKRHQLLNEKCFHLPTSNTDTYRYSYFPKTISEWNDLSDSVVNARSTGFFKDRLQKSKSD